jgi:hypothetical protein
MQVKTLSTTKLLKKLNEETNVRFRTGEKAGEADNLLSRYEGEQTIILIYDTKDKCLYFEPFKYESTPVGFIKNDTFLKDVKNDFKIVR